MLASGINVILLRARHGSRTTASCARLLDECTVVHPIQSAMTAARVLSSPSLSSLESLYDDAAVRAADLEHLVSLAGGYGSRESFLTELTLDPPEATSDRAGPPLLDEDVLILSTIHLDRCRDAAQPQTGAGFGGDTGTRTRPQCLEVSRFKSPWK
jgi:hypothetical protein